ncbi:MAG: transaldolase family protein, partial [candidate division Zixibacteria bacterium]|nr:transaldolase family protein [candidate division Zixibacteria bacterium]
DIAWKLIGDMGKTAAELLLDIFKQTNGMKGRLAVQVNPTYYRNSEKMIAHGKKLFAIAPNITIKLPATQAGIIAMEELTAQGVSVTATVCYSVAQAIACAEAMERGLARYGKPLQQYIAIMVGRLDDQLKRAMSSQGIITDPGYLEWAGVATFKKAYGIFEQRGYTPKLLAAAYRNHMQWSQFIGGGVVLSMPYKWWNRFNASDVEVIETMDEPVNKEVIDQLYDKFEDFRKAYDEDGMNPQDFEFFGASVHTLKQFINSYNELLEMVRERMLCR